MIGETIKIGFDGKAVKRGLAGITKGFSRMSNGIKRSVRQVGIGVGREMGSSIFGSVKSALASIPNRIDELGGLEMRMRKLGLATGTTSREILAMSKAMEISSGIDFDSAYDRIVDMKEEIGTAIREATEDGGKGAKIEALNVMGVKSGDIMGKSTTEQFAIIAKAFKEFRDREGSSKSLSVLEEFVSEGKEVIPLLLDFENNMAKGRKESEKFNKRLKENADNFRNLRDAKRALDAKFTEFSLDVLKGFGENGLKGLADAIKGIDLSVIAKTLGDLAGTLVGFLSDELKSINEQGVWEYLKSAFGRVKDWLAEAIGSGIEMGIQFGVKKMFGEGGALKGSMIETMIGKDAIGKLMTMGNKQRWGKGSEEAKELFGPGSSDFINKLPQFDKLDPKVIEDNTGKTNILLEEIINMPTTAKFA